MAGFAAIEIVVTGAVEWLAPGGTLLVEHAASHGDAVRELARDVGLVDALDHDDLAGLPRFLSATRPS